MTTKMLGGRFVTCSVRGCGKPVDEKALADLCDDHLKPIWPESDKVLGESDHTRLVCDGTSHRGVDKRTGADYRVCECDCALRSRTAGPVTL